IEKHQSFQEAHVVYLTGDLIRLCWSEEVFVGAVENPRGIIGVQENLAGGIRSGGKVGITRSRMIAGVVQQKDTLVGNQGRRTGFDEVAIEHALARRKDGAEILAVFSDERCPVDQVIRCRCKYVRVTKIHPVLSSYSSGNQPAIFQP